MIATAMNTGAPTYILPNDVMTTRENMHVITYIHYTPPPLVYTNHNHTVNPRKRMIHKINIKYE